MGQVMPLDLADFLARDEDLARLRRAIAAGTCDDRRPPAAEADLVSLLTARWHAGLSGWLTRAEAELVAAELDPGDTVAAARVETLDDRRPYLIFAGGPHGEHRLALSVTGPVLARMRWTAYLLTCGPRRRLAVAR